MSNPRLKNATDMIRWLIEQDVEIRTEQGKKICESFAEYDRNEAMSLVWQDMLRRKGSFDATCSEVKEIKEYAKAGDPSARLALEEEEDRQRLILAMEAFEKGKGTTEAEEQQAQEEFERMEQEAQAKRAEEAEVQEAQEAEEDAIEVIKLKYDGVDYLRDRNDIVYDSEDHFEIGRWDKTSKTVIFNWSKSADEM